MKNDNDNQQIKQITCPFCNNKIFLNCSNHGDISVKVFSSQYTNFIIRLSDKNYSIYLEQDTMLLWKYTNNGSSFVGRFPIDPNLTPENFEEKVKLYLTFQ